ncbi:hypothetical protein Q75_13345 [Bacillus coahuilensis p1.1.43]|uniref:Uncharacterized protein n=1 Tax=Bacillus coahuilensis p1.1.43 TaxID=1150625 RepID=A0A147K5Z1_9BACI|nr:hypothetical protein [Bacillus coahuilensis]KUP05233.1 hypothetical protein Q75_13345 [Bacillus coahuilensis p1.1.43]
MTWYSIGAFTFPATWAAGLFAVLIACSWVWFKQKEQWPLFSDSLFWFFLIWKLSPLLFDFHTSLAHPFTLLYYFGDVKGVTVAFLVAFTILFVKSKPWPQKVWLMPLFLLLFSYKSSLLFFDDYTLSEVLILLLFLYWFLVESNKFLVVTTFYGIALLFSVMQRDILLGELIYLIISVLFLLVNGRRQVYEK